MKEIHIVTDDVILFPHMEQNVLEQSDFIFEIPSYCTIPHPLFKATLYSRAQLHKLFARRRQISHLVEFCLSVGKFLRPSGMTGISREIIFLCDIINSTIHKYSLEILFPIRSIDIRNKIWVIVFFASIDNVKNVHHSSLLEQWRYSIKIL